MPSLKRSALEMEVEIETKESEKKVVSEIRAEFEKALDAVKVSFEEALGKMKVTVLEAVNEVMKEARETRRLDFNKGVNPKSSEQLLALGIPLEGDEGTRIAKEEKMLGVNDFLLAHPGAGKKFRSSTFSKRLKAAKLRRCVVDGTKPYLQNHLGEWRIAYMASDIPLMTDLLREMRGPIVEVVPEVLQV